MYILIGTTSIDVLNLVFSILRSEDIWIERVMPEVFFTFLENESNIF